MVVKPRDSNHGRGVFTGLTTREQVAAAFDYAADVGSGVLVERFAPGAEHRVLVVDGHVVAASRGEPAVIVGDGARSVAQLIDEQLNSDPRRGEDCSSLLYTIELDAITTLALEQQGYAPDSVPEPGARILVKRNGNVDTDVTERVHPEVAARAVEAARSWGSTSPGWISWPKTSAVRSKSRGARSSRSTRGQACKCTSSRPTASLALSAKPSSAPCFHRARPDAFRWLR